MNAAVWTQWRRRIRLGRQDVKVFAPFLVLFLLFCQTCRLYTDDLTHHDAATAPVAFWHFQVFLLSDCHYVKIFQFCLQNVAKIILRNSNLPFWVGFGFLFFFLFVLIFNHILFYFLILFYMLSILDCFNFFLGIF